MSNRGGGDIAAASFVFEFYLRAVGSLIQGAQNTVVNAVENGFFGKKFHFRLGRMDIHIHCGGRKSQMQYAGGEFAHHDLISVGFFQCCHQQLGLHRAVIDKEGLQIPAGAGIRGLGDVARQGVLLPAAFHLHHFCTFPAVNAVNGSFQSTGSGGGKGLLSVPDEGEGHLGVCQGLHLHGSGYPAAFDRICFHEFHSGGGIKEQVTDDDSGAIGASGLGFFGNGAGFQMQTGACDRAGGFSHQVNAADGCDGGQGFATETHGGNSGQILSGAQLAGCMAQEGGFGILGSHAAAVVGDPQEGHAAITNLNGHLGRTGIHSIFQQLLDNGCRPFHHLTGGDEVGNMGG